LSFFLPAIASAHEVYVLDPTTIQTAINTPSPNPLLLILSDSSQFSFWAMLGIILISVVFLVSIFRPIERLFAPTLRKIKPWAPLIARLTFGVSLVASSVYGALFGPELTLVSAVGAYAPVVRTVLFVIGVAIMFGLFTRTCAVIALILYVWAICVYHDYMITYVNYLGEIIVSLFLGGGLLSLDNLLFKRKINKKIEQYTFVILRVLFGTAMIYASWYAKIIHSNLALDTVANYHLTNYFHFSPLFLILGAALVETMIGVFIIIGFEIRFAALFFLIFLCLSLCFFGEVVWPHLILLGVNFALIAHGYDRYSLEGRFLKKGSMEPVL
jgi:uncharacterized membrane protein YphA (DoxX/SURF4 family)